MYVLYYASMLQCWHLVWILVRTGHPCLGVGYHMSTTGPLGGARAEDPRAPTINAKKCRWRAPWEVLTEIWEHRPST
jgi:hypothetical protein